MKSSHNIHQVIKDQYPWDCIYTTNLVLILKVKNPILSSDFKPLTLCIVIYIIIAKIFINRLRIVPPNIISPNQAGFVKWRFIIDNAMIGIDIMHHIYRKYNLNMTLKFDMTKTFDKSPDNIWKICSTNFNSQLLLFKHWWSVCLLLI